MQVPLRYARGMNRSMIIGASLLACATPALAQGQIGTIERGSYVCELPGDVTGTPGIEQPQDNFIIASASRYISGKGNGSYLRRGDEVHFTSGARKGESFKLMGNTFLRRIENGQPGRLRCIRRGS
jgi:hypothetical protein